MEDKIIKGDLDRPFEDFIYLVETTLINKINNNQ